MKKGFVEGDVIIHKLDAINGSPSYTVIGYHWDQTLVVTNNEHGGIEYYPQTDMLLLAEVRK